MTRSRFVCHHCTKQFGALLISPEPFCPRCLRKCQIQPILSPNDPPPHKKTFDERLFEKVLGRAQALGSYLQVRPTFGLA